MTDKNCKAFKADVRGNAASDKTVRVELESDEKGSHHENLMYKMNMHLESV